MTETISNVAIVNDAGLDDMDLFVEALRAEAPRFASDWSVPIPGVALYDSVTAKPTESAAIFIVDSTGDESAFARHSALGVSYWAYVDVSVCKKFGEPVTRAASHEFWEMLVDPPLDRWIPLPDGTSVAAEIVDPINRLGYKVTAEFFGRRGDVELSGWVKPNWYNPGSAGPWDSLGATVGPLQDAIGGYHQVRDGQVLSVSASARLKTFGRSWRRMALAAPPF